MGVVHNKLIAAPISKIVKRQYANYRSEEECFNAGREINHQVLIKYSFEAAEEFELDIDFLENKYNFINEGQLKEYYYEDEVKILKGLGRFTSYTIKELPVFKCKADFSFVKDTSIELKDKRFTEYYSDILFN